MREFVTFGVVSFLTLCHVQTGWAQQMLTFKPDKPIICYQSNSNRHDHVSVSDKFKRLRQNSSGRVKSANFDVEYMNFPPNGLAKTAFQYAIEIWESELTSVVPIKIRAEWVSLEPNVLGQTLWGRAFANFDGAQHMNTFYPVALAEKISRKELNPAEEPDIVISLNSNAVWYYKTDGNTLSGQMDMVTIVLHEIAHGLGFSDTYDVKDAEGSVGLPSGNTMVPFIFDLFVENDSDENLFNDFDSPSDELGAQLQNTNLFFNTPMSLAALSGMRPKLFAPTTFDRGSSISHLDEGTFNEPEDANRLMTPHIAKAESIHDPGSVLLAMLSDMGWVNTYIEHTPLKDVETKDGTPFTVTTVIRSDSNYDHDQVELHYTTNGTDFTTVAMIATGTPHEFEASLPGTTDDLAYAYYISVVDEITRIFTNPGRIQTQGEDFEQGTFFFNIGPDMAAPDIEHEPVEFAFIDKSILELTAVVTDNAGIEEVIVEYFFNDDAVQTTTMQAIDGSDVFSADISLSALSIGDLFQYRIIARDVAANENISMIPNNGYFTAYISGMMPVQDAYSNDFNTPSYDFFGNNFSIALADGFDNGAVHSTHPYPNGTGLNEESHYFFQLQVPILIDEINPHIRFDEIVLVEPGEDGSEFEDGTFYDFVVVEGSSDGGASWQPFAPGYDARAESAWLNRYNSDITNDNSEAAGDKSLYRERIINMLEEGTFSPGDEVLIRFRLFADVLARGWGWAIDNLAIQGPVTDIEQPLSKAFKIYPVPVKDDLNIEFLNPQTGPLNVQISDLQGRIIYSEEILPDAALSAKTIDMRSIGEGFYILKAGTSTKTFTRKFLKVSR